MIGIAEQHPSHPHLMKTLLPSIEPLEHRIAPATLIGVDSQNRLIAFDSASPGVVTKTVQITGLGAGEQIVDIDFQPREGKLFALGLIDGPGANDTEARMYTINPTTGAATWLGLGSGAILPDGDSWSIDFSPVNDHLRVVSSSGLNLDVYTGLNMDNPIVNPGDGVSLVGLANDRNYPGTTGTTVFGIDYTNSRLVRLGGEDGGGPGGSPATGTITPIGSLGVALDSRQVGFDISVTGDAFVTLDRAGSAFTHLYSVNLETGAATDLGTVGTGGPIYGLTAVNYVWEGSLTDKKWSTASNWRAGFVPKAGDSVLFPDLSTGVDSENDLAAGTAFHSLIFKGRSYYLTGNALTVTSGILTYDTLGTNYLGVPITLGGDQYFTASSADDQLTFLNAAKIDLNGHRLTLDGPDRRPSAA